MATHGLTLEQIGYRRQVRTNFRGLACQEFAEDEETCFRASGDSVFELGAVEIRLASAPEPVEMRRNGELEIGCHRCPASITWWASIQQAVEVKETTRQLR